MKQINERPSKYTNIGQDVIGAQRHNFDTYDNPESRAQKERDKASKVSQKAAKDLAIASLNETNFIQVILDYEVTRSLESFPAYTGTRTYTPDMMKELRAHVVSLRSEPGYNTLAKVFNRLANTISRVKWRIRTYDAAKAYLAPKSKDSFTEFNGVKRPWKLDSPFEQGSVEFLQSRSRAVQFGNSLTDGEREYCLQRLAESISILSARLSVDFASLAFSFGARGKAGSVAHYDDSKKVLAFNRNWDGAFIHELGHAIDYALGKLSHDIPSSIRCKYRDKLQALNLGRDKMKYYTTPTELFARMFEQWVRMEFPECTSWMQTTYNPEVMPDLDADAIQFMTKALKPLVK